MKKFLAFLLAMMVAMSMFTFAFAEDGENDTSPPTQDETPTYTDEEVFYIPKVYFLENANTNSPEVTFEFKIENITVTDSDYYDSTNMPSIPEPEGGFIVTFSDATDITVAGVKIAQDFPLPDYIAPGIFTYKISEKTSNVAGVTLQRYNDNNQLVDGGNNGYILMKVYVVRDTQDENEFCRVVRVQYEDSANSKIDAPGNNTFGILNKYSAGNLCVSKTVTGNMGDRTKQFDVTVTLNAPEDKTVLSEITYYIQDASGNPGEKKTIKGFEDSCVITEKLRHDEKLMINNIPYGVTYSVKEADYTSEAAGGYDAPEYTLNEKLTASNIAGKQDDGSTSVNGEVLDTDSEMVGIKNNKGMQINTGLVLDTLPYIILLVVAAAGVVVMMMKKRASREE